MSLSLTLRPIKKLLPVLTGHMLFWTFYITLEIGYLAIYQIKLEPWSHYFVYYGLNLGFFYGMLFMLALAPFVKKVSGIVLVMLLFLAGKFFAAHFLDRPQVSFSEQWHRLGFFLAGALFRGLYFGLMAVLYWLAGRQAANAKKLAEARAAYLQQQINPHLLFNALNLIYTRVYQQSEAGARPVYLLSEIMRYSLTEPAADGRVPLKAEIEQILNLIEINASRFAEPLQFKAELQIDSEQAQILPLVLFTFTENIFKHGNLLDAKQPALLRIEVNGQRPLTFFSSNLKKHQSVRSKRRNLGLLNARTRLQLHYRNNYTLNIREDDEIFELSLTLPV